MLPEADFVVFMRGFSYGFFQYEGSFLATHFYERCASSAKRKSESSGLKDGEKVVCSTAREKIPGGHHADFPMPLTLAVLFLSLGSSRFRVGDNEHRDHVSPLFDPYIRSFHVHEHVHVIITPISTHSIPRRPSLCIPLFVCIFWPRLAPHYPIDLLMRQIIIAS